MNLEKNIFVLFYVENELLCRYQMNTATSKVLRQRNTRNFILTHMPSRFNVYYFVLVNTSIGEHTAQRPR